MIRRWHVEPDVEVETANGWVQACSRQALEMNVADAVALMDRAGGGFSMWAQRAPTGLPGEMLTVGAIVEWRDRTDAKEVAEKTTGVARPAEPQPVSEEPPPEDDPTHYHGGEFQPSVGGTIDDGLDESLLPEEDDSAVEERV